MGWNEWIRVVEVEPSLYAADFSRLSQQVDTLLRANAKVFHFDIGDGHFVPPITAGPIVMGSISALVHDAGGVLDCHLMIETPEKHFAAIRAAGGDSVTVHYEACPDLATVRALAREHGLEVGLAFNPETDVREVVAAADGFDLVLCMSIHPGYSGQDFMPEAIDRIDLLRRLLPPAIHVQVDGGVKHENIRAVREAGANLIVCGSAIFGREDLPRTYRRLVHELV